MFAHFSARTVDYSATKVLLVLFCTAHHRQVAAWREKYEAATGPDSGTYHDQLIVCSHRVAA